MDIEQLVAEAFRSHRTNSDVVAHVVREAIYRGLFKGGEQLRQDDLAERFKVSPGPVREAFRQLEAEGMVVIYPHRGAFVTELSAAEALEISEIRVALETTALRLAIPRLTDEEFLKAQQALVGMNKVSSDEWGKRNWEFHAILYGAANRPMLLSMIRLLHLKADRYLRMEMQVLRYSKASHAEHVAILDACRAQSTSKAIKLLEHHIRDTTTALLGKLKT
jgi:DNA-binding GntR family transcriptional regulator